ncbi:MAG: DUF1311 domain-containing protein [Henriciella sp.]|nr:DUF1311 domain-containing protein [Henriciella sp.]
MWKEVSILIALAALSHSAFGQIDPRPDRKGNEPVPLTWEEFTSPNPPYPFEDELEECIRRDKFENRGNGDPCRSIPYEYCSLGPEEWTIEVRDRQVVSRCYSYVRGFWQRRLDRNSAKLLERYAKADRETSYPHARRPQFEELQALWDTWRDTRCFFESDAVPHYGWIQMAVLQCEANETSAHALDVERWLEVWD